MPKGTCVWDAQCPQVTLILLSGAGCSYANRIRRIGARHDERLNSVPHGAIVLNFDVRPHESACEPTVPSAGNRAALVLGFITPQDLRTLRIHGMNGTPAMKQSLRLVEVNRFPYVG